MKRPAFLLILGAACLAAGFSSYRIGLERATAPSAASGVTASMAAQATDSAAQAIASRPPAEWISLKEKLKQSYAACPSAEHDWILRSQTAAVLATMTTVELTSLLDEIFTGAPLRTQPRVWEVILGTEIMRVWGRRDPLAACTVGDKTPPLYRMAAFRDWLARDPAAVARWMASGDDGPAELRKAWLSERVKADPRGAIQQLAWLPPEEREASLLEWSTSFALLHAERQVLLDAVRDDPVLLQNCASCIVDALADRSVEEAYAFVDSLDPDEKTATSLDDRIFVKWGMNEPQVAFAAWAKQKQTRLPLKFLHVLDNWSLNSPGAEQAIEWLDTVETGPLKEEIQLHFIEELTHSERFGQAVRMGLSMANREEGKRQVMRVVATWKEKFPGDEKEWTAILREDGVEIR